MEQWHDVVAESALRPGGLAPIQVAGRALVLCRNADGWFALADCCSHAEARLSEGWLRGSRLVCPLHGAAFDLATGAPLGPPANRAVATFPVRIRAGRVEVAVPG